MNGVSQHCQSEYKARTYNFNPNRMAILRKNFHFSFNWKALNLINLYASAQRNEPWTKVMMIAARRQFICFPDDSGQAILIGLCLNFYTNMVEIRKIWLMKKQKAIFLFSLFTFQIKDSLIWAQNVVFVEGFRQEIRRKVGLRMFRRRGEKECRRDR